MGKVFTVIFGTFLLVVAILAPQTELWHDVIRLWAEFKSMPIDAQIVMTLSGLVFLLGCVLFCYFHFEDK
jgi:RsiW-degrading membrane proteinase PrsW (M82 family)